MPALPTAAPPAPPGEVRPRRRRLAAVLLLALVLATAVRVVQVNQLPAHDLFTKYASAAADLRAGRLTATRFADLSPAYLAVVTAAEALGSSATTLVSLQVAALGLVALLVGTAAWRWGGPLAGVAAAAAVLGSRLAVVNATDLEPETLVLVLDAAAVWLLARQRPRVLVAGLVLGLGAVARPTGLLVAAVAGAWLLWRDPAATRRRRAGSLAALLVGLAVPLLATAGVVRAATGSWLLMNPGTVLYEGWNPRATGLTGEVPQIVTEVEEALDFPDALHQAYRIVTERIAGEAASPRAINRYWTGHAVAWVTSAPGAAARLLLRKLHATFSSYAAWDLASAARAEHSLGGHSWIPFGLLAAAALAGAVAARRLSVTLLLVGIVAARAAVPLLFYSSARLRLPMLAGLAVLAGLACAAGAGSWRRGRRFKPVLAAMGVLVLGALLQVPSPAQREDRHAWQLDLDARSALNHAQSAIPPAAAETWRLRADLDLAGPATTPAGVRASAVRHRLATTTRPARRFDLAIAAARAGDWQTCDATLAGLAALGYRPIRGWAMCSSLAYHRARARLHLGDAEEALVLARRALTEAPGDPDALALAAELERRAGNAEAARVLEASLDRLHDPFTATLARSRAALDAGDPAAAHAQQLEVLRALPIIGR